METKIVALCTSLRTATTQQLASPSFCGQFVGADWVPMLIRDADRQGIQVISGKEALGLPHRNLSVIQEDLNPEGKRLVREGAKGQVIYCLESPIFVRRFYDLINVYKSRFKHAVLFQEGTEPAYFPSFHEPAPLVPWEQRRNKLVMISAAKHLSGMRQPKKSPAWEYVLKSQLHDARFGSIHYLGSSGRLDLFGRGWGPGVEAVKDKIGTLREYRFSICFENLRMPGYVTEKIIDCFVAGVIPIYLGAPDIEDIIPPKLFLDFRRFKDWNEALAHIDAITPTQAMAMIDQAREWLGSQAGQKYTHRRFAGRMLELIQT